MENINKKDSLKLWEYLHENRAWTDLSPMARDDIMFEKRRIFPSEIMRRIKGGSARKLFETFPELKKRYWRQHFWARGYFCVTSGEVTEDMIKNYIEHHFEPRIGENFEVKK